MLYFSLSKNSRGLGMFLSTHFQRYDDFILRSQYTSTIKGFIPRDRDKRVCCPYAVVQSNYNHSSYVKSDHIASLYLLTGIEFNTYIDSIHGLAQRLWDEIQEIDFHNNKKSINIVKLIGLKLYKYKLTKSQTGFRLLMDLHDVFDRLMTPIENACSVSFFPLVNYWENVIAKKKKIDISSDLLELRQITDKYSDVYHRCVNFSDTYAKLNERRLYLRNHDPVTGLKYEHDDYQKAYHQNSEQKTELYQAYCSFFEQVIAFYEEHSDKETLDQFLMMKEFTEDTPIIQKKLLEMAKKYSVFKPSEKIYAYRFLQKMPSMLPIETNKSVLMYIDNVNQDYDSVISFSDLSFLVKRKGAVNYELVVDFNEVPVIVEACLFAYLRDKLKKHPHIFKAAKNSILKIKNGEVLSFKNMSSKMFDHDLDNDPFFRELERSQQSENFDERLFDPFYHDFDPVHHSGGVDFRFLLSCLDSYFTHENILKLYKFNIVKLLNDGSHYERIDDVIHRVVKVHTTKQAVMRIMSNKYKHLFSNKCLPVFEELMNNGCNDVIIQNLIGKKIAAIKTPDEFYDFVVNTLNTINEFTFDIVFMKIKESGAELISNADNRLIVRIHNFQQAKLLGSSSWCLCRDEHYLENYTSNKKRQYFMYDFNKPSTDFDSLIGCTLSHQLKYSVAHSKNDEKVKDKALVNYLTQKVQEHSLKTAKPHSVQLPLLV